MKKPEPPVPTPGRETRDPLARLDSELASFEASRQTTRTALSGEAGAGYRLLGQMLGGVLGGIGLGWLVDQYAHTSPWGLVLGLLIGAGLSIYSTVRTASRMGTQIETKPEPTDPVPDDDDDA